MDRLLKAALVAALAVSGTAWAKVGADKAAALGDKLTPVGAEKAGNADGSIPAWSGGLTTAPPCFKGAGSRYCDPFPDDKPQFTITSANLEQYKGNLTPGQLALFAKYGDTYKMPVYQTRRTFANPQFVYDATAKNAVSAELGGNGEALTGAITGIPFPIPGNGHEVIWNHKVRFRDTGVRRWNNQFAVTTAGAYNLVKIQEDAYFVYSTPGIKPEELNNKILYFLQLTTEPPRLAGTILLVHETMDQVKEPRGAWQYNPGQRRLRRAPNIAYDNPGTASDGLRTNDQLDMFNGAMDRYEWKLLGKKEMYVPANSYRLHSDQLKYKDIIKKGHLAQEYTRYEKRRVWVVDSFVKKGVSHLYKRRTFYVDEDSWQIVAVDVYDQRDQLWRVQEGHHVIAYDKPYQLPALETVYDLQSARYLVMAANNEDAETATRSFTVGDFDPTNVSKLATK
ncbi:DUF1329 domain-containing protein [Fontimonas sp. SYSU GA230001]|uniref:DUF1329 domain-containing protein n=1 Tax=Fontimonas sp. SYSU GA230001 TaxID=3142450 RepID=UPI0032B3A83D